MFKILVQAFDDAITLKDKVLKGEASLADLREALFYANKGLKIFQ